eukprot:2278706-Pleurochrysis_carterae.AAC.1
MIIIPYRKNASYGYGCLRTREAYILTRGVLTLPYLRRSLQCDDSELILPPCGDYITLLQMVYVY